MKDKRLKGTVIRFSSGDKVFFLLIDIFLLIVLFIVFIPMWSTITLSFRPNTFIGSNLEGMFLAPWKWSPSAYRALLGNRGFLNAFINSGKIFIYGVAAALFLTIPLAYVLSVKTLPGRKILVIFVLIPYLYNVELIPTLPCGYKSGPNQ